MAIGETLRNAREELGLSETDVAERTHMMVQMVREIEREDFHRFSAPVYGKGFIKLFAKAVGLDPAPFVAEFLSNFDAKNDPRQKTFVPLETMDAEPGAAIRTVTPEGQPHSTVGDTPPPAPHLSYSKASSVTMPMADSPYAINTQTPPPPLRQPVPPIPPRLEPVKPRIPISSPGRVPLPESTANGEVVKPKSTAEDLRSVNTFKLEADHVASAVPPQPVAQPREPFKFPSPVKRLPRNESQEISERPAPIKRPPRNESQETPERPSPARRTPEPRRRTSDERVSAGEVVEHIATMLNNAVGSLREKISALISAGDDEESKIRNRYVLAGILVFMTVLAVIIIAASSSDNSKDDEAPLIANHEIVEPIADEGSVAPDPTDSSGTLPAPEPAVPAAPVEIVRVMPPPRMFAK